MARNAWLEGTAVFRASDRHGQRSGGPDDGEPWPWEVALKAESLGLLSAGHKMPADAEAARATLDGA